MEFDHTYSYHKKKKNSGMAIAPFLGPKVKICGSPFNKTQQLLELQWVLHRESLAIFCPLLVQ